MTDEDARTAKFRKYAQVATVFTPGAPIDSRALFAGRIDQVMQVISAVAERGRHIVLYGERGVGKTSLANVLGVFLDDIAAGSGQSVRVNCNTTDDFQSIWLKILREIGTSYDDGDWTGRHPDPEDIRFTLERAESLPNVIIVDELDRVEDVDTMSLMADTVKTLSDHTVPVTILFVGVANSIDELIDDHRSVERALAQVRMQRMSTDELEEILSNGLEKLELGIEAEASTRISLLSEGLPHFTHLLAQHAAQRAVTDDRDTVRLGDVEEAMREVVKTHSLLNEYERATRSPRTDNLFEQVLTACALARKDELGYFTASAVRDPMSRIMGKRYEIPAFARHLKRFSDPYSGILIKDGEPRRYVYRFLNPLLQPFSILKALSNGFVTEEIIESVDAMNRPAVSEQGELF